MKKFVLLFISFTIAGNFIIAQPVNEIKKLLASDGAANDHFGYAVSISGDNAIVGAYNDDDYGIESGSAYVFYKDMGGSGNWGQVAKLTAADAEAGDLFGISVSISGDYAVVGSMEDYNGNEAGAVYLFNKDQGGANNWGQIAKIVATDGSAGDRFGISVSIDDDLIIVGAFLDDDNGTNSGSAYLFYKNQGGPGNWGQLIKLTATDGAADDRFGNNVSISDDYAVVGACYDDDNGSESGSAYVFYKDQGGSSNWGQVKKIIASDATAGDCFGISGSIYDDHILIGAMNADPNGNNSGAVYLFGKDQGGSGNWGQIAKLIASDGAQGDRFGYAVDISLEFAIVGALNDDDKGSESGSAYIFNKDQGGSNNWGQVEKIVASDAVSGELFGAAVGISSEYILVGANSDDDNGSESGSAYVFMMSGTGIESYTAMVTTIFPNPTHGKVYFDLQQIEPDKITVKDITGKTLIESSEIQQNLILDLTFADPGIYLIFIQTVKKTIVKKIIRE
ncbi:T9SS type A sorting domain-containing protein [candidate division KSB1 bacterium]